MESFEQDISFFEKLETAARPISIHAQRQSSHELRRLFDRMKEGTMSQTIDQGRNGKGRGKEIAGSADRACP